MKYYWIGVLVLSIIAGVIADLATDDKWYEIIHFYLALYAGFMYRLEVLIEEIRKKKK